MIEDEQALNDRLTAPRPVLVEFIRSVRSPLVVLGAGGKMGPTLAVLARRAAEAAGHALEVIAVSRFSDPAARAWLDERGVHTLSADLLDRESVRRLPEASDVIHLVGLKFGTRDNPAQTWAVNTLVPAWVAERFREARVVALSTGNVYPLVPAGGGGAVESLPLTPAGEYANAAVARERIFEYVSQTLGTRVVLMRLNYAVELRYGVIADIARAVHAGEPVNLANGWFNCIWQGDANEMILRALPLAAAPPAVVNLTGPAAVSVREVAGRLAALLGRPVRFTGNEAPNAFLSNVSRAVQEFGPPPTDLESILCWTADWVKRGRRSLNKPTHFEVRDGAY